MANSFQNEQETPELVTIAELAENLVYRLPGCADIMVRKTIQEVYREFCRETKCLTAERIYDIVDGREDYPVGTRHGGVVGEIRDVWIENRRLVKDRDYVVVEGSSKFIRLSPRFVNVPANEESATSPIVAPSPWGEAERNAHAVVRKLRIVATEFPRINSEQAPSWFVEKYGDAITSGVLARLMAMTGKPWSDAQQAIDERRNYENAKSEARMFMEMPFGGSVIDMGMTL